MYDGNQAEQSIYGGLDPSVPLFCCKLCGEDIYPGHEYYHFETGDIYCADCKEEYLYEIEKKAERIAGLTM